MVEFKVVHIFNFCESNIVQLSGALFTKNPQYEEGTRDVNNNWVPEIIMSTMICKFYLITIWILYKIFFLYWVIIYFDVLLIIYTEPMLDHIRWFLWRKWIYKPLNILVSFIFYTSNSLMSLMISLKRIPVPTVTAHSKNPYVHFYFLWDWGSFVPKSLSVTNLHKWQHYPGQRKIPDNLSDKIVFENTCIISDIHHEVKCFAEDWKVLYELRDTSTEIRCWSNISLGDY